VLWPFALAPSLRSTKPLVQWLRSGLMIVTTGFNFVALRYLQLDQTVTIFFLTPLIVAALAGPLLDEWIGWYCMVAVVAGFRGVLLVMHPDFGSLHWANCSRWSPPLDMRFATSPRATSRHSILRA